MAYVRCNHPILTGASLNLCQALRMWTETQVHSRGVNTCTDRRPSHWLPCCPTRSPCILQLTGQTNQLWFLMTLNIVVQLAKNSHPSGRPWS